jgi:hypothetical protein
MIRLLAPNSWAGRISQRLTQKMPRAGAFVYLGSCMTLEAGGLQDMSDSDEWEDTEPSTSIKEIREKCSGIGVWEQILGYGSDTIMLEEDWHVGYGKGTYRGTPCYWISHSRIDYVWVENQGVVKCDTCGDESNSPPFLSCGRAPGKDEDETQPPHCGGTYLPLNPKKNLCYAPEGCHYSEAKKMKQLQSTHTYPHTHEQEHPCTTTRWSRARERAQKILTWASRAASNVSNPENCVALGHLSAHPHVCPTSITLMVLSALYFVVNLFRRS